MKGAIGKGLAKLARWLLKHPEVVRVVTEAILERKKPDPAK